MSCPEVDRSKHGARAVARVLAPRLLNTIPKSRRPVSGIPKIEVESSKSAEDLGAGFSSVRRRTRGGRRRDHGRRHFGGFPDDGTGVGRSSGSSAGVCRPSIKIVHEPGGRTRAGPSLAARSAAGRSGIGRRGCRSGRPEAARHDRPTCRLNRAPPSPRWFREGSKGVPATRSEPSKTGTSSRLTNFPILSSWPMIPTRGQ